ncbi:MAG TPA: VTT domain-containing protein [Anaerolineales bacterium]|nr:VTT domain-containing protein [Anaerolineales bacterium]
MPISAEQITEFIQTYGANVAYIVLFAIVFAESGLFFGFFLPGDSLLLTAGLLASPKSPYEVGLNILILLPLLFVAAVTGDSVGYWFGAWSGPRIFSRENSLLFRRKNLLAAKAFYDKHGGKTIIAARFMPFIRTFAPIVAGAVEMEYKRFLMFNVVGGLAWGIGVTLIGYFLGNIPGVEKFFTPLVLAVIVISALPAMIHLWNEHRDEILARAKTILGQRPTSDPE